MQAAPWWGVPLIAGAFLVIGALLGFLFNLLLERVRRNHSAEVRRDEQKAAREAIWTELVRQDVIAMLQHMDEHLSAAITARQEYFPAHLELLRSGDSDNYKRVTLIAEYHKNVDVHLTGLRTRALSLAMSNSKDLEAASSDLVGASARVNIEMSESDWDSWRRDVLTAGLLLTETAREMLWGDLDRPNSGYDALKAALDERDRERAVTLSKPGGQRAEPPHARGSAEH